MKRKRQSGKHKIKYFKTKIFYNKIFKKEFNQTKANRPPKAYKKYLVCKPFKNH